MFLLRLSGVQKSQEKGVRGEVEEGEGGGTGCGMKQGKGRSGMKGKKRERGIEACFLMEARGSCSMKYCSLEVVEVSEGVEGAENC